MNEWMNKNVFIPNILAIEFIEFIDFYVTKKKNDIELPLVDIYRIQK